MSNERKDRSFEEYLEKLENMSEAELAGEIHDLENAIIKINSYPNIYGIPYCKQIDDLIVYIENLLEAAKEAFEAKLGFELKDEHSDKVYQLYLKEYNSLKVLRSLECTVPGTIFEVSIKNYLTHKVIQTNYQTLFGLYERDRGGTSEYFIIAADCSNPTSLFEVKLGSLDKLCRKKRTKIRIGDESYRLSYGYSGVFQYFNADYKTTNFFKTNVCVFQYNGPRKMIDGKKFESLMVTKRALLKRGTKDILENNFRDFVVLSYAPDEPLFAEFTWYDMNNIKILGEPPKRGYGKKLTEYFPLDDM
jgi:hypothetical protein